MSQTLDLLPCPFCGGEATLHKIVFGYSSLNNGKDGFHVICAQCGIRPQPYFLTRAEAVELWNTRAALPPPEGDVGELVGDLVALRQANLTRQAVWCPDEVPDLSFRGNELGGEVGEALNVIKKLERERHGWRGSRDTTEHLAEELADVVICADLCAITAGIDLASAVVAKFNATSDKVGIDVKLAAAPQSPMGEGTVGVTTYRHKKRGTIYELVGYGEMQSETWLQPTVDGLRNTRVDMAKVAVYRSLKDGSLWVRPVEEFEDGRFEKVAAPE